MLKIIETNSSTDRRELLRDFDPHRAIWLVSDLETKLDIQKELFTRFDFLPEDAVLRAAEFWKKIFSSTHSDFHVVSHSFFETLLEEWLEKKDVPWASGGAASRTLFSFTQQFAPLMQSEALHEQFREWLASDGNQNALLRSGSWYFLAREAWQDFVSKKTIPLSWVPAFLFDIAGWKWNRKIFVDLEGQMTAGEVEIIKQLAAHHDVTVLVPDKATRQRHSKVLWPYSVLLDESIDGTMQDRVAPLLTHVQYHRWTTPLAEIRGTVSAIRALVDSGTSMNDIAVFAPDIELYWQPLRFYLRIEGIPVKKDVVTPLSGFKEVSSWLSRIKVDSRRFSSADLQSSLYSLSRTPKMSFAEFRSVFANIFEDKDLLREKEIERLFDFIASPTSKLSRNEFIAWVLKRWENSQLTDHLERLISPLAAEASPNLELDLARWISHFEKMIAKTEVRIESAASEGLAFLNLGSGLQEKYSHCFILGLSDDAVKSQSAQALTTGEIQKLGRDLGVFLDHPDKSEAEFYAEFVSKKTDRSVAASFSSTGFSGEAQAPSLFWLSGALSAGREIEEFSQAGATRWTDIQSLDPEKISAYQGLSSQLVKTVFEDLGETEIEKCSLKTKPSLSASQAERYLTCPFIFLAEKIYRLQDIDDVDFDLDRRSRGQLQHALLERLLEPPIRYDWSGPELEQLIDTVCEQNKIRVADARFWPAIRRFYINLARRFLDFEKAYSTNFPSNKNLARELDFEVAWSTSANRFIQKDQMSAADYIFRGKVDRIDGATGVGYVVIDYKATKSEKIRNWNSWIENRNLQLALYSQILEGGLMRLPQAPVVAAFYYILKTFDRGVGFELLEDQSGFFDTEHKRRTKISEDTKLQLFQDSTDLFKSVVEGLETGQLSPNPRDPEKDCATCNWRRTCRAPHLN